MRTICISLPHENPERTEAARQHFAQHGINAEFFVGVHGEKMGLNTTHPYMVDRKEGDELFFAGPKPVGIFLSHYMLWDAMQLLPEQHTFILEDDAKFQDGWKEKFERALQDVPADFDILFVGSCCCNHRPTTHIKGLINEVKYPMCFHAYVVAKKAVPHLLATNRDCYAPIDISVTFHSFDKLKVYTILPRIVDQFNTEIEP